ncbi:Ig-like and fibronectin type-III domain-containing protein 1 isoform X2 [Gigantopelta aegis]|uniref:Ig-like and fibronectin type-III domain-containing protein 1 isoform X2 n=1 Tax=Gigantopelta aegis TaxID=1735272 RepID=UPI001B88D351|nr:Ig-like and fibronectin type-III domain-containing protein 1 isoform X2 [Gigantopelta aegis]
MAVYNTRRKTVQSEFLLLAAILFSLLANVKTGITTKPDVVVGNPGSTAVLSCQASEANSQLDWWFLDHKTQISSGRSVLINDASKYSLIFPQDSSGYMAVNLQIRDLKTTDHGYYRCVIHGTQDAVTHQLTVIGAPKIPTNVNISAANFTACCRQESVSEQCMPACHPSSVDRSVFNETEVCASDLNKLLKCFSDARNHIGCCRRRLLPEECLDFCANNPPTLSLVHLGCLRRVNDIISCFEEGQVLLPSVPVKVSALNLPGYRLLVSWLPPSENAKLLTGYRVSYRQTSDQNGPYSHTAVLTHFTIQYTLTGLEANKRYTIYVTAIGKYGASQPSERIDISTSNDISQPGQDKDIKACCVARKVSSLCRDLLCTASVLKQWDPTNLAKCYPELEHIFSCLKGERNHTTCCKQNNIPTICLGFCGTKPPSFSWDFVECVSDKRLSTIEACVQQGLKSLPSAPQSVMLTSLGYQSADISWSPPVSGDKPGQTYLVQLREKKKGILFKNMDTVTGTYIKLTNLKSDTLYEVRVITVGNESSSLPSLTITFLTKPDLTVVTPPQVVAINNETACCIKANVSRTCMPGCTYDVASLISFFGDTSNLFTCVAHIPNMMKCGADGRNHTNCCAGRGVNALCSKLCSISQNDTIGPDFVSCFGKVLDVIQCYEEGRTTLPKHPDGVRITKVTTHTISLTWNHPASGGQINNYIVRYKEFHQDWQLIDTKSSKITYIIQDLKPSHEYEINVLSSNDNGVSVPSASIVSFTKHVNGTSAPVVTPHPLGKAIFENKTDCCKNQGVSAECMHLCLNKAGSTSPCYVDADKIIACGADGKDHTPCCHRRGVPDSCLSLCKGQSMGRNHLTLFCLTYTVSIQTCFYENDGLIPSPPTNFATTEMPNQFRQLTWGKPSSNCDSGCTYSVHYWEVSPYYDWARIYNEEGATTVENVTSGWVLSGLKTSKVYRVTVSAHNEFGGSQPAPSQSFYIQYSGIQDVTIFRDPGKPSVLKLGQTVTFSCVVIAQPRAKLYWMFNNKNISHTDRILAIKSITKKDSGIYTCVAYNSKGTKSRSYFLNIKFKPSVVKVREDNVQPDEQRKGVLVCWFDGYPDQITWTKNGQVVSAVPSKVYVYTEQREHTGIVVGKLKFANVVSKDFGLYRCNGSNAYGYAVGAVQLIDPDAIKHVKPGSKPPNITACCINEGIHPDCMAICSFDIDINKIFLDPSMAKCITHLVAFSKCAADGRDHTKCCANAGVIDLCLPFCKGVIPGEDPYNTTLLACIDHTVASIRCVVKGHDNIPSIPLNVFAKIKNKAIDVHWSAPRHNAEKVESYHVFYNSSRIKTQYHAVSNTIYTYAIQLPDIESNAYFFVWVVAFNDFGESHKSEIKYISMKKESPLSRGPGEDNALGVGLGVGLTILVIIVIAVVIFFVFRRRWGKGIFSNETVAFENPGYGRSQPQVTGLPSETMQPVGQFSYDKLDEPLSEHTYQELEPNGRTPATLPIDQEQVKLPQ